MRSLMLSLAIAAFGLTLSASSALAGAACAGGSCPGGKAAETAKCVCKADAKCEGKCEKCKCAESKCEKSKCEKPKCEESAKPKVEAPKAK